MKLKELAEFVNQLAAQHQSLQERVYALEKMRMPLGVVATDDDIKKLKKAAQDLHESLYCSSPD